MIYLRRYDEDASFVQDKESGVIGDTYVAYCDDADHVHLPYDEKKWYVISNRRDNINSFEAEGGKTYIGFYYGHIETMPDTLNGIKIKSNSDFKWIPIKSIYYDDPIMIYGKELPSEYISTLSDYITNNYDEIIDMKVSFDDYKVTSITSYENTFSYHNISSASKDFLNGLISVEGTDGGSGSAPFISNSSIVSLNLGDTIENLGPCSVQFNENLTTLYLPSSVTYIASGAVNYNGVLATIYYNGVAYTTLSDLTAALVANGVAVDENAFTDNAIS